MLRPTRCPSTCLCDPARPQLPVGKRMTHGLVVSPCYADMLGNGALEEQRTERAAGSPFLLPSHPAPKVMLNLAKCIICLFNESFTLPEMPFLTPIPFPKPPIKCNPFQPASVPTRAKAERLPQQCPQGPGAPRCESASRPQLHEGHPGDQDVNSDLKDSRKNALTHSASESAASLGPAAPPQALLNVLLSTTSRP